MKQGLLDMLKDLMELTRNFAFGLGLFAFAYIGYSQNWNGEGVMAPATIGWIGFILSAAYLIASICYFTFKHQPKHRVLSVIWVLVVIAVLVWVMNESMLLVKAYEFSKILPSAHFH